MALDDLADALSITGGLAAAVQSGLVPRSLATAPFPLLVTLGDGYPRFLGQLPLLAVRKRPQGGYAVGPPFAARALPLISFASPYLAGARGGLELRYPIVCGLSVRAPGGHLAFGIAPEGSRARLWIDVLDFRPRLGLGPLYFLTQAQLHRLITVAYLRRVVQALVEHEVVHSRQAKAA